MWTNKSGNCRVTCLCPFSFGLALGVTSFLAALVWSIWVMHYGMSPMMEEAGRSIMVTMTWGTAFAHAAWAFLKGFIFGFVLVMFYDLFACTFSKWCKGRCCSTCNCDSKNCTCGKDDTTTTTRL